MINTTKLTVIAAASLILNTLANMLGGFDKPLEILLLFIIVDIVAGFLLAVEGKSTKTKYGYVSSQAFSNGLVKKGFELLVVVVAANMDMLIGVNIFRELAIYAFIVSEGISILEHAITAGAPVPDMLKDALKAIERTHEQEKLKELYDDTKYYEKIMAAQEKEKEP